MLLGCVLKRTHGLSGPRRRPLPEFTGSRAVSVELELHRAVMSLEVCDPTFKQTYPSCKLHFVVP